MPDVTCAEQQQESQFCPCKTSRAPHPSPGMREASAEMGTQGAKSTQGPGQSPLSYRLGSLGSSTFPCHLTKTS